MAVGSNPANYATYYLDYYLEEGKASVSAVSRQVFVDRNKKKKDYIYLLNGLFHHNTMCLNVETKSFWSMM